MKNNDQEENEQQPRRKQSTVSIDHLTSDAHREWAQQVDEANTPQGLWLRYAIKSKTDRSKNTIRVFSEGFVNKYDGKDCDYEESFVVPEGIEVDSVRMKNTCIVMLDATNSAHQFYDHMHKGDPSKTMLLGVEGMPNAQELEGHDKIYSLRSFVNASTGHNPGQLGFQDVLDNALQPSVSSQKKSSFSGRPYVAPRPTCSK